MAGKCKVSECFSEVAKGGFCNKHYIRNRRHGDPLKTKSGRREPGTRTAEDDRESKRVDYQKNKDAYIARAAAWRAANPEKYKAIVNEYLSREEVKIAARERAKEWAQSNKDRKREYDRNWIENNRAISRSHKARRRAKERTATPPWLTETQLEAIKAVYLEAERLFKETGIPYQVDHIVPLSGKTVSGLHVPWNLRAIPAQENNRRPRVWDHNTQI